MPPMSGWGRGLSVAQAPTWRLKPERSEFGKSARQLTYGCCPACLFFFYIRVCVYIFPLCKSRENTLIFNSRSGNRRVGHCWPPGVVNAKITEVADCKVLQFGGRFHFLFPFFTSLMSLKPSHTFICIEPLCHVSFELNPKGQAGWKLLPVIGNYTFLFCAFSTGLQLFLRRSSARLRHIDAHGLVVTRLCQCWNFGHGELRPKS